MNSAELTNTINLLLGEEKYADLFNLMDENRDTVTQSNALSYLYYLCSINRNRYAQTGDPGMMRGKKTVSELYESVCDLKRMVQRVSFCPEYDASAVPVFMNSIGANATELLWLTQTSTPNPDATMNRIIRNTGDGHIEYPDYDQHHDHSNAQFEFVICSNDPKELEETIYYINRLEIPEGVSIDVISVDGAASICAGYNEGMSASPAKYKVYLHQDVRIIEKTFIARILDLFTDHPEVGLIGFVGTKVLPKDGTMWSVDRFGSVLETHVHETVELRNYDKDRDFYAMLCDGFMLATQYDIPWREDIFDGWDFYDSSQCMEFRRMGYKVMIPYQETPWAMHDCGFVSLKDYDKYREIFVKEYSHD